MSSWVLSTKKQRKLSTPVVLQQHRLNFGTLGSSIRSLGLRGTSDLPTAGTSSPCTCFIIAKPAAPSQQPRMSCCLDTRHTELL